MQHVGVVWRAILLLVLMITAGCVARRPDFMTRVREDCSAGEQWACDLLDALNQSPTIDGRRQNAGSCKADSSTDTGGEFGVRTKRRFSGRRSVRAASWPQGRHCASPQF